MNKKLEKFTSYLDFLYNWLLPQAILYGMTAEQFWYDEPQLFFSYARAYEMQQERKVEYDNWLAWLYGQYHFLAISQSMSAKKGAKIYPQQPFEIGKKEEEEVPLQDKFELRKQRAREAVDRFKKNNG